MLTKLKDNMDILTLVLKTRVTSGLCLIAISCMFVLSSCKKDWLDAKPDSLLTVPSTISDFQNLLNYNNYFNSNQPGLGELATDDYYFSVANYSAQQLLEQYAYIWAVDVFNGSASVQDWDNPYKAVLNCNLSVEGLAKITPTSATLVNWNTAEGTALFYRSFEFFNLVQTFAMPFDSSSFRTDLGIPLKLSSDVNDKVGRGTVQNVYDQILADLHVAATLLPTTPTAGSLFQPGRNTVYGLLTRVYLSMNDYFDALKYADSCLAISSSLLDYNTLNPSSTYPITHPNDEVIFDYNLVNYSGIDRSSFVDSLLYMTYDSNDLRRSIFFTVSGTGYKFKGGYYPAPVCWGGIATDEMYLSRAECWARMGNTSSAMGDLNTLLSYRYKTGTFIPYNITDPSIALDTILLERRKELLFRGTRWLDLRRLNKEPAFAATLTRILNGQTYTLPPNDPRYAYPIPQDELLYNPIPQNQR
jgi:hypothetical protein